MQTPPLNQPGIGVGILVIRNGKVLLGRRRNAHGAGTWSPPGGKLEWGETFEQAAQRELHEEAGLDLGPTTPGPTTNDVIDEANHYVTVFVIARQTRGEPVNAEPHKCEGWQWFAWSELPAPLFAPMQSLVEQMPALPG